MTGHIDTESEKIITDLTKAQKELIGLPNKTFPGAQSLPNSIY